MFRMPIKISAAAAALFLLALLMSESLGNCML